MPESTRVKRDRNTKIVATLGPASSDADTIRKLFVAGVDVFRLNFSHGRQEDHAARLEIIRSLETEFGRPIAAMADLHLRTEKVVVRGRTRTSLAPLRGDERVAEVADMIAGGADHSSARAEAERLLEAAAAV